MSADSIYLIKLIITFVDNSQVDGKYLPHLLYFLQYQILSYNPSAAQPCLMISLFTKIYISAVRKLQWIYF